MVDTKLLKSEIVKMGFSQCEFCKKIGMPQSTFIRRMRKGVFKTDEVSEITRVLKLKKPEQIFFANKLT